MSDTASIMFDIEGITNVQTQVDDTSVFIDAVLPKSSCCPTCLGPHLHKKKKRYRTFRLPPVGQKLVKLKLLVQQQYCLSCGKSWWPKPPFVNGKQRMTKSFIAYALDLLTFGTIKDVADHLNIGWDCIKDIHKNYLRDEYEAVNISDIEYLSIDEFSIAKRHKYMTIFLNLKTGRIVHAVEGRRKKDILPFLEELKKK